MSVITLLTDFGSEDEYVGVMKGVILTIQPSAVIVDISHHIEPQNITQAAFMLQAAHAYFPAGSVHIVVVDPGVGSGRHILAVKTEHGVFLAPDNGVLTAIMDSENIDAIVRVEDTRYFLTPVSRTFHGRDIFAPVGAHLAGGLEVRQLGSEVAITETARLRLPKPGVTAPGELTGTVIAIDRFGNLVTCIDAVILNAFTWGTSTNALCTTIGQSVIIGIRTSYRRVPKGHALTIVGSRGLLEISVNRGSAQKHFNANVGDPVTLTYKR